MTRLNLIDVMCLVHIGTSVGRSASYNVAGFPTGGMYEVLKFFRRKIFSFDDTTVFCFDRPSKRKKQNKDYKSNRTFNYKTHYQSIELESGLSSMGFTCLSREDFESDDIIYSVVQKYKPYYDEINIWSTDRDYAALVDEKVTLKSVSSRVPDLTKDTFTKNFSPKVIIPYNSVYLYKIFFGDSSDTIPNIARKVNITLDDFYKLCHMLQNKGVTGLNLNSPKLINTLIDSMKPEYKKIIRRNADLVLPYYGDFEIHDLVYNRENTINFLSSFRMKSIANIFGVELVDNPRFEELKAIAQTINQKTLAQKADKETKQAAYQPIKQVVNTNTIEFGTIPLL